VGTTGLTRPILPYRISCRSFLLLPKDHRGAVAPTSHRRSRSAAAVAPHAGSGARPAYGTFMASYITWKSRIGKLQTRDRILDAIREVRGWTGEEVVPDVGCGRG
jgi:hypothetical protein